jgi:thioesterase domain-containing protein
MIDTDEAAKTLVCLNTGAPGRRPVFLVHGADGLTGIFEPLAARMGAAQPVYALRARGLDGDTKPLETIEEMARLYVKAIERIDPTGPYILGGHSGGGAIAFEMAQILKRAGRTTALIAMIDTVEPHDLSRPITMKERLMLIPKAHPGILLEYPLNRIRDFRSYLYRKGIAGGAEQTTYDAVGYAYLHAQTLYKVAPYDGSILLIKATKARAHYIRSGRYLGWDKAVPTDKIEIFVTKGEHLTMFKEPAVTAIANAINARLDKINAALQA